MISLHLQVGNSFLGERSKYFKPFAEASIPRKAIKPLPKSSLERGRVDVRA